MKRILTIFLVLFSLLILSGCIVDKYQITNGYRKKVFIPIIQDNFKAHLFWYYPKDENNKFIKDDHKRVLFDANRDTIIFVHGWQGVGRLGWTNHSLFTKHNGPFKMFFALISLAYNVPGDGASFPTVKKKIKKYNIAFFDWQEYNNIDGEFETSEQLSKLEANIRHNPIDWPSIPKNLAKELDLLLNTRNYNGKIIIIAHSLGNQVVLRTYKMLSPMLKNQISRIVLLDPFTTNYYDFMNEKAGGDYHWLSGSTSGWIKKDLTNLIESSGIKDKLRIIYTTDIGKSWYLNFAKPLDLTTFDKDYKDIDLLNCYARKTKKFHNKILDYVFSDGKYDAVLSEQ